MTDGRMELHHEAAVRAAAGLSDVGGTVDAAAESLSAAVELAWGNDAVGTALAARYDETRQAVADALPAFAESLRRLDSTVRTGAAALIGTDTGTSAALHGVDEGRA